MYIQMLKNQHVTFVNNVEEAEKYSPFFMWLNSKSGCYVVSKTIVGQHKSPVAAGLTKEEAEAAVMFKANEFILRSMAE